MKALVIGGTGLIGIPLADILFKQGHQVTLVSRGRTSASLPYEDILSYVEHIIVNRKDMLYFKKLMEQREFDIIYDLAAYAPRDIIQISDLFANQIHRYIFVSTAAVYGKGREGEKISEEISPYPITWHDYGRNKLLAEEECTKHSGLPYIIIRPSLVYGPRDSVEPRASYFFRRIYQQIPILIPGKLDTLNNYIYTDDLAQLLYFATDAPVGSIYNAAGAQSFTLSEYLETVSRVMRKPCPPVKALGMNIEEYRHWEYSKKLEFHHNAFDSFVLDCQRAEKELKWNPRYGIEKGIAQTWSWYWNFQRDKIENPGKTFDIEKQLFIAS